jgi:hypothetical protein
MPGPDGKPCKSEKERPMPTMSDQRRKRIQARQRKAKNILKREAKAAKRARSQGK